jgi:uncharacterized protein YndB with AHSA1/START domain
MKNEPFVIERILNAPAKKVWKALTNTGDMKNWYFDIDSFKPEVGYEFQFSAGSENKEYLHLCKVMEVVRERKLSYSWKYDGYPGKSLVSFELFPEGDKTRLKLTHSGLETFPSDQPDFAKENFAAGWTEIIGNQLKEFVEKESVAG